MTSLVLNNWAQDVNFKRILQISFSREISDHLIKLGYSIPQIFTPLTLLLNIHMYSLQQVHFTTCECVKLLSEWQTMWTPIRCPIVQHLIWVYTVWSFCTGLCVRLCKVQSFDQIKPHQKSSWICLYVLHDTPPLQDN